MDPDGVTCCNMSMQVVQRNTTNTDNTITTFITVTDVIPIPPESAQRRSFTYTNVSLIPNQEYIVLLIAVNAADQLGFRPTFLTVCCVLWVCVVMWVGVVAPHPQCTFTYSHHKHKLPHLQTHTHTHVILNCIHTGGFRLIRNTQPWYHCPHCIALPPACGTCGGVGVAACDATEVCVR